MLSNPSSALSLFLLLQLVSVLALVAGGLYLLFCLGRAAAGLDRLADVAEAWLALQQTQAAQAQAEQTQVAQRQAAHARREDAAETRETVREDEL